MKTHLRGILDKDLIKKQILDILKEKNSMNQNQLARYVGISPNSLKKIANELVTNNLIKKNKMNRNINYTLNY
ncbi:MAG: winged helix-turn-helix transcriptional regulator [Candidatus Subteraquimicrobiales bacterium]|nr:winged helix-turn-helix transcriptional regulator [Candidatus Subteraquimicrobiales bacterium]